MPYQKQNWQLLSIGGDKWSLVAALQALENGVIEALEKAQVSWFEYSYNVTVAEPPSGGQLRMDVAETSQVLASKLWISDTTAPGASVGNLLGLASVGGKVYVQDKDVATRWRRYTITSAPLAKTAYHELPVSYVDGGDALAAQRVLVGIHVGT